MHHNTAVRRLRTIAEDCDRAGSLLGGNGGLVAVYAFGPVLDQPGQELEAVNVVLVVDMPAAELPWGVEPPACSSLAHFLRLDKAPVLRRWSGGRPPSRSPGSLLGRHRLAPRAARLTVPTGGTRSSARCPPTSQ